VDLAPDLARLVPAWCDALSRKDGAGCSAPTLASKTTVESSLASPRSSHWRASQNRDFTRSPYPTNVMTENSLGSEGRRRPHQCRHFLRSGICTTLWRARCRDDRARPAGDKGGRWFL